MTHALAEVAKQAGLVKHTGGNAIQGIEGMDDSDLKIGTIVLVHPTTKFFVKKGVVPGKFANTVTEAEVVDTTFIPAFMKKVYDVVEWESKDKSKYLFTVHNENDPRLQGKRRRNEVVNGLELKAEVIPNIKVIALLGGQPVAINFKKMSAYPAGQKLFTFIKDALRNKNLQMWGQKYRLISKDAKNGRGTEYLAMDVEVVGPTTDDEQALAYSLFQGFTNAPEPILEVAEAPGEEVPF